MAFAREWWRTEEDGRRIGYMDPVEFVSILSAWYGDKGWVARFCEDFGYSRPTIYRYNQGFNPIPKDVAMSVLLLSQIGGPKHLPKIEASWLPDLDDVSVAAKGAA